MIKIAIEELPPVVRQRLAATPRDAVLLTRAGKPFALLRDATKYDDEDILASGEVICVTVTGNRARIGGVVQHSDFPEGIPVGSQLLWSVTDNGEGHKDEPDTASPLLGTANAASFCAAGAPAPEFPVGRGNIQVKP